jgi:Sulfotransferase family
MTATARPDGLRVLYIAGWGRSGSTLLDRMLGQLPGVVSVGEVRELWFRGGLENRRCGCGEPFADCPFWSEVGRRVGGFWNQEGFAWMAEEGRALDRIWGLARRSSPSWKRRATDYATRLRPVYAAIADVAGASVVVDSSKLPNYAPLVGAMPDVDVRVVHLVRDSRGVVHSWRKRVERPDLTSQARCGDTMEQYGVAGASARYVGYNGLVPLLTKRAVRVRYEDLVRDPRRWLAVVAGAAGIDLTDGALDWLGDGVAELGVNHTVDGNPMRLATGPVPLRLDDAWRNGLPRAPRAAVTTLTFPLLAAYGYLPARAARAVA